MKTEEINDLYILIDYNDREFEKVDDFKKSLNSNHYNYQLRPTHIPAAAEGAEMWMTILINSDISLFIFQAITGGLLWDIIKVGGKKYILKPLFDSIEKLNKGNSRFGGLKILTLKFQFDNCEIIVGGLRQNFTAVISSVFQEVARMKPKFEEDQNGRTVIKIELPVYQDSRILNKSISTYQLETYYDDFSLSHFKTLWRVTFATEYPVVIYDFDKKQYIEEN